MVVGVIWAAYICGETVGGSGAVGGSARGSAAGGAPARGGRGAMNAAVGRYGEGVATSYLRERGFEVLERNWRGPLGEVDIIALDGSTLVICEVKTRRGLGFGAPVEQVTRLKAARLRRLAAAWIEAHPDVAVRADEVRVDVIGVLRPLRGAAVVEHLVAVA